MQVRTAIEARLTEASREDVSTLRVRLPTRLKSDKTSVRVAMFQRLAASRLFAYGDRAGCLRAAQNRSGRLFRLDVRQRVMVKALVSRHAGKGFARGAKLASHVAYLGASAPARTAPGRRSSDRSVTMWMALWRLRDGGRTGTISASSSLPNTAIGSPT